MESDAWHLRIDVLTSVEAFVGLVLVQITYLVFLDAIIVIIVVLLVLRKEDSLINQSLSDLTDKRLDQGEIMQIKDNVYRHKNAAGSVC